MQCPRCGLQNSPGVTACARCGLPVQSARGGASAPPMQPPADYAAPPGGYQPAAGSFVGSPPGAVTGPTQSGYRGPPPGPYAPTPPRAYGEPVPYGARPPYPQPAGTPPGSASSAASPRSAGRLITTIALAVAAVLAIGYALWEFTARRGIFQNFVDGRAVSVGDARSNDRLDTTWLIVAGVVALIALALWLMRRVNGETTGGLLDNTGLVLAVLGVVVAVMGLYLASGVGDAVDQATSGQRGVNASLVIGTGFAVLAIGLVLGMLAVRGGRAAQAPTTQAPAPSAPPAAGSYQGW